MISLGRKKPLVDNPLLIEGISRSGKFLLANLLHGFRGVEHVQYYGPLEHIPFLEKFRLIDKRTAQEILQCEVDTHAYEMLIGRNLNYRRTDKSSIFHNPAYKKYLERCKMPDGDPAVKRYKEENLTSMYILHEVMPNIRIYFDVFPKVKIISIKRSPVYLVYSWYMRGLGKRFGNDPKLFSLPIEKNGENIPWFTAGWEGKFLKLEEMDRCIASIEWIVHASRKTYSRLNIRQKKRVLYISYEGVLTRTVKTINKIENFLDRPVEKDSMKAILRREKLPNLKYSESKDDKLLLIKKKASPFYFQKLLNLEADFSREEEHL